MNTLSLSFSSVIIGVIAVVSVRTSLEFNGGASVELFKFKVNSKLFV